MGRVCLKPRGQGRGSRDIHDTLGSASAAHRERDTSPCAKGSPESVEAPPACEWL